MLPPPRIAILVLVTADGSILGALPPLPVATPWWQEAEPVVAAARDAFGLEVTVLRLLSAAAAIPHGGATTYLAEVTPPLPPGTPLEPWTGTLDDDPLRMSWARPAGPAADLAWATGALADLGRGPSGPPVQVRSWNLSSLWRIPVDGQNAWLKVVPPFFAHEGAVIDILQTGPAPRLIAHDGPRILMHEIPGEDLYDADPQTLRSMVSMLVELQVATIGRVDPWLALGLTDRRAAPLQAAIQTVIERTADELGATDRATLAGFAASLPERLADIAECGLPDTLVHGDFHPGNTRGSPTSITLLDWGDSGIGHPLLDEPAFLDRIPEAAVGPVRDHWHRAWREAIGGSDPARAATLLRPVATARQAVDYRMFLDRIERSERPYHAADPAERLRRAAEQVRATARRSWADD